MSRQLAGLLALVLPACSFAGQVRSQAATDFPCPESQVQAVEVTASLVRATGCGKDALYNRYVQSPMKRAAFDLSCPEEQLKMSYLGDQSVGVVGCGKKASYAWLESAWIGGTVPPNLQAAPQ